MKRSTHIEAAPRLDTQPSRVNPYPRALMIGGIALIAYGVIAPAVTLFRTVASGLRTTSVSPLRNTAAATATATATHGSTKETESREIVTRERHAGAVTSKVHPSVERAREARARKTPATAAATAAATLHKSRAKGQDEIMKLYAEWKDAWKNGDIDGFLKLYSPDAQFRMSYGDNIEGHTGMKRSVGGLVGAGYTIVDTEAPGLSIVGDHATLVAAQIYTSEPSSDSGPRYNHRFFLEHQKVENKNGSSGNARPWRIVKSEFIPFNGNKSSEEIY